MSGADSGASNEHWKWQLVSDTITLAAKCGKSLEEETALTHFPGDLPHFTLLLWEEQGKKAKKKPLQGTLWVQTCHQLFSRSDPHFFGLSITLGR